MKVVLFCGGQGMRLREYQNTPKPLAPIGDQPLLWHLMRYYAHYGHRDFILCLGYRGADIKDYFLNYRETVSNDFVLAKGGREVTLLARDIDDWTITFVDTGQNAKIGERLKAVQPYLEGEETFLANYADGLTDLPLDLYLRHFGSQSCVGMFVAVRPQLVFHVVDADREGFVREITHIRNRDVRINGGFFVFRRSLFDYLHPGEELVEEPFRRLSAERRLLAYPYDGFWRCLDTFQDKQAFEDLVARGDAPWQVWKRQG
jgi:glucose-1-phosphate cytidylyltransferase